MAFDGRAGHVARMTSTNPMAKPHDRMSVAEPPGADGAPRPGDGETRHGAIKRFLPLAVIAAGGAAFFAFGGHDYVSLQRLADNRDALKAWTVESPLIAGGAYMLLYVVATALSLPIGLVLTLAGGFVFGTLVGGALTVIGATVGATLLFLAARTAFADYFRDRLGGAVRRMRDRFEEDAFNYILALRLLPVVPFVVANAAPALAGVKLRTYVVATAIGIVPGTFVYASVGAGLDVIFAAGGEPALDAVFKPQVFLPLLALALLALAPTAWKRFKARRGG